MYPYDNQNNNGSANWDSDSGTYHYKYSNPQSNPDSGPEAPQRKPKKSHKGAGKVVAWCCVAPWWAAAQAWAARRLSTLCSVGRPVPPPSIRTTPPPLR